MAGNNEELVYAPQNILENANIKEYERLYRESLADPTTFWSQIARELEWYQDWTETLDETNKPFFKWFVEGRTNIVANALDCHLKTQRKNKVALI
jgi:acetyl-CoA synthetase